MTILWTVNDRDGKALPLRDKEVHLYYTCERGRFEADIEIQGGNVVAWNFLGRDQRALGNYTLSLEILQSDGKRTIKMDKCNAFSLVGRNCEEVYDDGDADINEGGELAIVSNLDIYRISPIIPYVVKDNNGIGYWYVDGVKTGDRSTGESAYEYALTKGFDGTEEEFAALTAKLPNVSAELGKLSEEVNSIETYLQPEIRSKVTILEGGYITFDTIELSKDGDCLDIEVMTPVSPGFNAFAFATYNNLCAIGLGSEIISLRTPTNWVDGLNGGAGQKYFSSLGLLSARGKVKIEYANGGVNVYINDTLLTSLTSQPQILINGMGKFANGTSEGYWAGTIYALNYTRNGVTKNLANFSSLAHNNKVEIETSVEFSDLKSEVKSIKKTTAELGKLSEETTAELATLSAYLGGDKGEFNKVVISQGGYMTFDAIELSKDGDCIEVDCMTSVPAGTQHFAFLTYNGMCAIGLGNEILSLRKPSGWVDGYNGGSGQRYFSSFGQMKDRGTIKVEYTNGGVSIYVNGSLFGTLTSQPQIFINGMGRFYNGTSEGFWVGTIYGFKYTTNGVTIGLDELPSLSHNDNVAFDYINSSADLKTEVVNLKKSVGAGATPIMVIPSNEREFSLKITNDVGRTLTYKFYRELHTSVYDSGASIKSMDVWHNTMIYNEDGLPMIQGNSNFIFAIDGEASGFSHENKNWAVGPNHGCEVLEIVEFFCDGKAFNPTVATEPIACASFRFVQTSKVYATDATLNSSKATGNINNYPLLENGIPILAARHYIDMEWKAENDITWNNVLVIERDGTKFRGCYAGMLQTYPEFTNEVWLNDKNFARTKFYKSGSTLVQEPIEGGGVKHEIQVKCNRVGIKGDNLVVSQEMYSQDSSRYGKMNVYTYFYNDRIKCYMQPCMTTLVGGAETFNKGDMFNFNLRRKIDIS